MSRTKLPDGVYYRISPNGKVMGFNCVNVTLIETVKCLGGFKKVPHRSISGETSQLAQYCLSDVDLKSVHDLYENKEDAIKEAQRLIDASIIAAKTMLLNAEKRQMNLNASK